MIDDLAAQESVVPVIMAESNLFSLVRNLVKEELGLAFLLKTTIARDPDVAAISCDPALFLDLYVMVSQFVIPAAILSGNPDCNLLKSWMPDRGIRA